MDGSAAYHGGAAVGGSSRGAHLGRDVQAGVDARAGQASVHLVVTHHGERCGVGAGDGQRGAQSWRCCTQRGDKGTAVT